MTALPTGTVTFLFTDIEGSTRLLHSLGEGYRTLQDRHDEIVRAAVDAEDGHLVRTIGDSFLVDEADNSLGTVVVLEILSGLESAQGQHQRAVRLFASARQIQRKLEGGLGVAATDVVGFRCRCPRPASDRRRAVARALAEGRSMSRADALAYARDDG